MCYFTGHPRSRRRDARSPLASRPAFRRTMAFADAVALLLPMISQPAVPETALKRRKRDEAWAAKKATADAEAAAASKKNSEEIFKRAEKYVKEYRDQVRFGETRPRARHTNTSLFPTPARRHLAAARRGRRKAQSDRRGGLQSDTHDSALAQWPRRRSAAPPRVSAGALRTLVMAV